MATDFFERQDRARAQSGWLIFYFALAVLGVIVSVDLLFVAIFAYVGSEGVVEEVHWLEYLLLILVTSVVTLFVIALGTLYKTLELRQGASVVAESLGGREILSVTEDSDEQRLLNIVEEMALASGTPMPKVYILDHEQGINAFACGLSVEDSAVAVTRGCLELMTRDELQGVIAHEFSHILNGDCNQNTQLIGWVHGLLVIFLIGYYMLRLFSGGVGSSGDRKGGNLLPLIGLVLMLIGGIGWLFARWIRSAVSRQREYLADASAVQFTRNPDGIGGALKLIGGYYSGSKIESSANEEVSHMFFADGTSSFLSGMMTTHPPLDERIRAIDPHFNGEYPDVKQRLKKLRGARQVSGEVTKNPSRAEEVRDAIRDASKNPESLAHLVATIGSIAAGEKVVGQVGNVGRQQVEYAKELAASLPEDLREATGVPFSARAVVYASLLDFQYAEVREAQLKQLDTYGDLGVADETRKLAKSMDTLNAVQRIALLDLSVPALTKLTKDQYALFRHNLDYFIEADHQVDLYEFCLIFLLDRRLSPSFEPQKMAKIKYTKTTDLRVEIRCLLSALAWWGADNEEQAQEAYAEGLTAYAKGALSNEILAMERCPISEVGRALEMADQASPFVKKKIIQSAAMTVLNDGKVTDYEEILLRSFSEGIGCPMPPLVFAQMD